MKFRPTAHLDSSQVIDRRDPRNVIGSVPYPNPRSVPGIDPMLLMLLANHANPNVRGTVPVYVPSGKPFPYFGGPKGRR